MSTFPNGDELGVPDLLASLVTPGAPWKEWGVVEHQFHLADPALYTLLYEHYGHVTQGPRRYSVSAYLARRMGDVARATDITAIRGPGTGRWAYNTSISYWAASPLVARSSRLTWEQYVKEKRLTGHWWQIIDRDAP